MQAIYESQRAGLLQHAASTFQQAVGAGNWRGAEASLFVLGVAAPAVMRRQLVRNPERFLSTPQSKAEGLTAEGLAAEQAQGRELLTQLFGLMGAGTNSPIAAMLAQPALAAAAARLTAGYARWLAAETADELLVRHFLDPHTHVQNWSRRRCKPANYSEGDLWAREIQYTGWCFHYCGRHS